MSHLFSNIWHKRNNNLKNFKGKYKKLKHIWKIKIKVLMESSTALQNKDYNVIVESKNCSMKLLTNMNS